MKYDRTAAKYKYQMSQEIFCFVISLFENIPILKVDKCLVGGSPNEAGCLLARLNPAEYESVPSVD